MKTLAGAIALIIAVVVATLGLTNAVRVAQQKLDRDEQQDRQIADLEEQLRAVRAQLAPSPSPVRPGEPPQDAVVDVPIDGSPVLGDGPITIVEFADYQCPFCKRVEATLDELMRKNPDVRLVFKHRPLPFHPIAEPAARAAVCAQAQGRFWQAHRVLFALEQRDPTGWQGALERAIAELPREAGLDGAELRRCMDDPATKARVQRESELGERIGASGTPTFFVNGRRLVGAQPLDAFDKAVARARAEHAEIGD